MTLFRKINKIALVLALIVFVGSIPPTVMEAKKTTQEKLDDAEKEKEQLEDNIDDTKQEIKDLKSDISELQTKLNSLNEEMEAISDHLEDLYLQIDAKEYQIYTTEKNLAAAEEKRDSQYEAMQDRLRYMYEAGETTFLQVLFEAKDFSDLLTRAEYIVEVENYDRIMLAEYEENLELIETTRQDLEAQNEKLNSLKAEVESEQARVEAIIVETSNYVILYQDQVEDAEALAKKYEKELKEKEEDIEYLKKKLEEEKYLAMLAAAAQTRDLSEVKFEDGDRYLIATMIYCEAGGEIYAGKLAVGAVIINRLLNGAFANTVSGVLYQKNQFSPVASGRFALSLAQGKATKACYQAADEAMSGVTNVGNCLFFRTPTPLKTAVYTIGGHIFY